MIPKGIKLVEFVAPAEDIIILDCPPRLDMEEAVQSSATKESKPQRKDTVSTSVNVGSASQASLASKISQVKDFMARKMFRSALRVCEKGAEEGKSTPLHTEFLDKLAQIQLNLRDENAAIATTKALVKVNKKRAKSYLRQAEVYMRCGKLNQALECLENNVFDAYDLNSSFCTQEELLKAVALKADCLFKSGRPAECADVLNEYLSIKGADTNANLLEAYANVAITHGKFSEGLSAVLRCFAVDQNNKRAIELLLAVLSSKDGLSLLYAQLPENKSTAEVYALFAHKAKDYSRMGLCLTLYQKVISMEPRNVNHVLSYAHSLEVEKGLDLALEEIVRFVKANPGLRMGKNGFTCKELAEILTGAQQSQNQNQQQYVTTVREGDDWQISTQSCSEAHPAITLAPTTELLSNESLDLLALGFTAAKILYLQGRLCRLPALVAVLERGRTISKKPIHQTSIRNEHAFYICIASVLSMRASSQEYREYNLVAVLQETQGQPEQRSLSCTDPLSHEAFAAAAKNPLYFVGDSHVLSLAWSVLSTATGPRLVIPKLVTGVKQWHMRKESCFYPKHEFWQKTASLPAEADVILAIGEIDCREGLLLAVEKGCYADVASGISHTVDLFRGALEEFCTKCKPKRVFLHPIPPVLDETRQVVLAYDGRYQEMVARASTSLPALQWLDFGAQLLATPAPGNVKDEDELEPAFAFDGTHLSPIYAKLMVGLL
jgi:tetratricopeptide (TPR) repeat protein